VAKKTVSPWVNSFGMLAGALAVLWLAIWFLTQNNLTYAQAPTAFGAVWIILAESFVPLCLIWFAAAGYGYVLRAVLLGNSERSLVAQLGLGMFVLLVGNWLLAWAGWLHVVTAYLICAVGIGLVLIQAARGVMRRGAGSKGFVPLMPESVMLFVPGVAMLLVAACCPAGTLWRVEAFGYDVTSYHLQLPREWLAMGRMSGLEHNVYSFLPSLIEGGYLLIGTMRGLVVDAVYACQLFHVTLALLAAAAVGKTVAARTTASAGIGAAAFFLAVPWVIVTGSMAYNEMGVLAFGAAALMLAFDDAGTTRRGAIAIGLLVGAATLSKLTAGVMIAIPVGLILLLGLNRHTDKTSKDGRQRNLQLALIAALAGALTLSPYFVRNYLSTGNPVFPFAADTLGAGHWNGEFVQRWNTAHGLSPKHEGKLDALGRQWLFNTGFGAVGGRPTPRETQNMARFDNEGGVPTLWIAVVIAGVLLLVQRDTRKPTCALLLMLAVQVLFWMFATHMQSRFLLPTLLPACLIAGLGYDRLRMLTQPKAPTAAPLIGSAVVLTLAVTSYVTLASQTQTIPDPDTGQPLQLPIWAAIGAPVGNTDHPVNKLPADSRTLLVADNSGLLYLRRPFVYASAFDEDPLGKVIRASGGGGGSDPQAVNRALRAEGITHVWVHWSELARLRATYGHDRDVTVQTLENLIATGWRPVETVGHTATLYTLP
jgi:4-amino-4-deoxy-L-arabinose transferase-like glycosyltransferase